MANCTPYAPTQTPAVAVNFATAGSTEYLATAATVPLQVSPANVISIFDWQESVYVGAKNRFTFGLSIRRLPSAATVLRVTLAATDAAYALSPSSTVVFNSTQPLLQRVVLTGVAPLPRSSVVVAVTDTDNFFQPVAALSLTVLALERFGGTVSQLIVYSGLQTVVTVTLSSRRSSR